MKKDIKWKQGNNSGAIASEYVGKFATEKEFVDSFKKDNSETFKAMGRNEQILKDVYAKGKPEQESKGKTEKVNTPINPSKPVE